MSKPSPVIEARGVVKRFGGVTAVKGVSFAVPPGEFFGLLGPNGAGKTSLIRMIYGFSPLTGGELYVFGRDIRRGWRDIRSRIGVCQQENTLDPDLSVEQNLQLFARYFDIEPEQARERADELLDFFALGHKRRAKVMDLSGGMARRLTLARALVNNPELLILDEPTTGLDPQSRHQVWDRLHALRKRGLSLVLTTHYMEEASSLCDRLLIVDHGEVLVEGSPQGLIREHVGRSVIEIASPEDGLRRHLRESGVPHDDLENRVIVYAAPDSGVEEDIRSRFCVERCTIRAAGLEDVFMRLTGRGLRE
jgi:lipooligosaccharide transport system ATP-binding protein